MNLPDPPFSHDRSCLFDHPMESPIKADHRHYAGARGRLENLAPLIRVRREWFLEVEVLTGCTGGEGKIMMEIVGSANDHSVDVASRE
jgi:hypothetical protein